jgi:hypothetical protein
VKGCWWRGEAWEDCVALRREVSSVMRSSRFSSRLYRPPCTDHDASGSGIVVDDLRSAMIHLARKAPLRKSVEDGEMGEYIPI